MGYLLNQFGTPYTAAAYNRLTSHLPSIHRPTDVELGHFVLRTLRARARFIFQNHAHANGAIRLIVRRVAGAGLQIQARLRDAGGRYLREENEALERIWKERGRLGLSPGGFREQKFWSMLLLHYLVDGEVLLVRRENPARPGVTSEWQVLGGDMLAEDQDARTLKGVAAGNGVRMGVEYEPEGRPAAYHFYADGMSSYWDMANRPTMRVEAERVLHWFRGNYGDAARGVPILTPVILKIADLDEFFSATLTQAWAQACVNAFVTSPITGERLELSQKRIGATNQDTDYSPQRWSEELGSGMKVYLAAGEDMKFADPKAPSGNVDPFSQVILRAIAAGLGISYEALARDYTKTNYSSGRQTENEDGLTFDELAGSMDEEVIEPIWRDHVDHVYLLNRLRAMPAGGGEGGPLDVYMHYVQHPVKDHADPGKAASAYIMLVEARLESPQAICAERGREFHDVIDEIAEAELYMAERGVKMNQLAAAVAGGGNQANEDEADGNANENGGNGGAGGAGEEARLGRLRWARAEAERDSTG